MLKGPKRSFVVVLVDVDSSLKNVPSRRKIMQRGKFIKAKWEQSIIFCGTLWYWIALYGLVWPCMPLYGLVWPHMVLLLLFMAIAVCCLIQLSMALWLCDLSWSWRAFLWSYMAFWGFIWHFMVFSGNISSLFAVIDLNLFGLVYYWFNGNCHHSWYIHKQCTKNSANLLTFIPIYLINE